MRKLNLLLLLLIPTAAAAQTSLPACPPTGYKHNCFGTATYLFGYKYVGEYRDNKRAGLGATILPSGEQYVGEYNDDRRNGHGVEYRRNGTVIRAGLWANDNLTLPFQLDTSRFPFNVPTQAAVAQPSHAERDRMAAEPQIGRQRQQELEEKPNAESRERQRQVAEAEGARRQSEYESARLQTNQIRSNEERQCAGYGFVPGTTPFAQCVMQIDIAQRAALETRQQAERLRSQRYSQCKSEELQIWLEPGGGDFFQTLTRVQRRFESCMAGLPPPPSIDVLCNRVGRDQISCSSR